jgi:bifunctional oligoribonuclease and PAP phosphatase NrnA
MRQVLEAIKKYKRFLITAHVNLEGDSLGSQLAMKELLNILDKDAFILDHDAVPEHYKFLPKADQVLNKLGKDMKFDAALVLDCPTLKRIGSVADVIKGKPVISIDHHISNEMFGDVNWIDPKASSAGEMVFRLFKEAGKPLTKEAALYLYIAILTDTGSFNYENTSSITHEIAGELLGYGLAPATVSENVYERRSLSDIKLLGLVLSTIKVNGTGDVAYLEMTDEMLKETGADLAKSEGLINYARSIDKVKVAIIFKEDAKKKVINISFRSKGSTDVNAIASRFGGGGHVKASGCTVKGKLADVKKMVLQATDEALGHGRRINS